MSVQGMFSTPIGVYQLNRKFTKKEKSATNLCLKKLNNNYGNRYSKDTQVLNKPEFFDINDFCKKSIKEFYNDVYGETKTELRITQSWLNISSPNEFHHKHRHPNSYISGVLYIETTENDRINFYNPSLREHFFQETPTVFNQFNSRIWWLPATQGTLYLFHSDLEHEVPPVLGKKRISLSFNTFFNSNFGSETLLTYLPFAKK
jgi:uncharacterized protein (TIGR02466 family)